MSTKDTPQIDAASLAQKLKDKIHLDLVELMPDEVWKRLLQDHIHAFLTEQPPGPGHWHDRDKPRPPLLREVVHQVLSEIAREKLREMLHSDEWRGFWSDGKEMASVRIEEIIKENAADILFSVLQQSFQGVISSMREQM